MPCSIIEEDTLQVVSDRNLPWMEMKDSAVLITGATGLIGTALVRILKEASIRHNLNLNIIATGRNKGKLKKLAEDYGIENTVQADIREPFPVKALPEKVEYIFHCAAVTKSAEMVAKPVDVIETSVEGTRNILEIARMSDSKALIYLSSMEAYGQLGKQEAHETDLGKLDLPNPRSSYPESKRYCETLCAAYHSQFGVPVRIARLAQSFGAGTPADDTRVFAQFARSAAREEDIVLHTQGKSRGNYCYISDAISALLYILLLGKSVEIYNIANTQASVTIREMAEIVADKVCRGRIDVITEDADGGKQGHGYAPDVGYILNTDKLKALGWQPRHGLDEMYSRMLKSKGGE